MEGMQGGSSAPKYRKPCMHSHGRLERWWAISQSLCPCRIYTHTHVGTHAVGIDRARVQVARRQGSRVLLRGDRLDEQRRQRLPQAAGQRLPQAAVLGIPASAWREGRPQQI